MSEKEQKNHFKHFPESIMLLEDARLRHPYFDALSLILALHEANEVCAEEMQHIPKKAIVKCGSTMRATISLYVSQIKSSKYQHPVCVQLYEFITHPALYIQTFPTMAALSRLLYDTLFDEENTIVYDKNSSSKKFIVESCKRAQHEVDEFIKSLTAKREKDAQRKADARCAEKVTLTEHEMSLFHKMIDTHPNRLGTRNEAKILRNFKAIIEKGEGTAEEILESHHLWLESSEWNEQNGRFVPMLNKWLGLGLYKEKPTDRRTPQRFRHETESKSLVPSVEATAAMFIGCC